MRPKRETIFSTKITGINHISDRLGQKASDELSSSQNPSLTSSAYKFKQTMLNLKNQKTVCDKAIAQFRKNEVLKEGVRSRREQKLHAKQQAKAQPQTIPKEEE